MTQGLRPPRSRVRAGRRYDDPELVVEVAGSSGEEVDELELPAPLIQEGMPAPVALRARPGAGLARRAVKHRVWLLFLAADVGALALLETIADVGWRRLVLAMVLCVALFTREGFYSSKLSLSVLQQLPVLLLAPTAAMTVSDFAASVHRQSVQSSSILIIGIVATTAAVVAGRTAAYALVRHVRRRGLVGHNTLILGAGRVAADLARTLIARPTFGLMPVAFWDPDPFLDSSELSRPIHGAELAAAIRDTGSRVVIIAFSSRRESELVEVLRTCDRMDCEIFLVPRLWELQQRSSSMDEIWGVPLVRLRRPAFRSPTWRLKRLFDVVLVLLVAPFVAPVIAACALAVRLDTGPGVLFRQRRVGRDGREFDLLKFRSMRPADPREHPVRWSIAQDPRVSRIGRALRRTSLDELPQLWNVFRGDMSVVGPRPERPFFVKQFTENFPRYVSRSRVPAGLTGWAQVNGLRGDTSISDRAVFNNFYIENWSLWFDCTIIMRTVLSLVRRDGG